MSDEQMDLSRENLDRTMGVYGELLCFPCKVKLKTRCLPIVNKLNKGFPPMPREIIRLNKSLCKDCLKAVTLKKHEEERKK